MSTKEQLQDMIEALTILDVRRLDEESLTLAKFIRKKEGLSSSDLDTWAGIKASDLAPGKILNILKEKGSEALTILDVRRLDEESRDEAEYIVNDVIISLEELLDLI